MPSKCKECGLTDNYNFVLNIGLCDPCIEEKLERLEDENKKLKGIVLEAQHRLRDVQSYLNGEDAVLNRSINDTLDEIGQCLKNRP